MIEQVLIPSPWGMLAAVYDSEATGIDADGNSTQGALIRVSTGQIDGSVRMDSGTCGLAQVVRVRIQSWLAGDADALRSLGVLQPGGEFRQRAWQAMRSIPAGQTVTYAELAALAGSPNATRAAGSACSHNAIPIVVPCHRVVRSDGTLGNYSAFAGTQTKQEMLAMEARCAAAAATETPHFLLQ